MMEGNAALRLRLNLQHSTGNGNGANACGPEYCARSGGRCHIIFALDVDFGGSGRNYWWTWWAAAVAAAAASASAAAWAGLVAGTAVDRLKLA